MRRIRFDEPEMYHVLKRRVLQHKFYKPRMIEPILAGLVDGPKTIRELNEKTHYRIHQLQHAMKRLRRAKLVSMGRRGKRTKEYRLIVDTSILDAKTVKFLEVFIDDLFEDWI